MDLFDQSVLPPTREHLELLRYLLTLVSLIHFPFLGIVIGGAALSLLLNLQDKDEGDATRARAAAELMRMALPSAAAVIVFGVLPLPVLWLIYGQWLARSGANTMHLVPAGAAVVIAGLGMLFGYRRTLRPAGDNALFNIALGGAGLAAVLLGAYIYFGSVTRFIDPEKWFTHHHAVRALASWNVIWRYMLFIASSFAVAGGAILFFFFRWPGSARATGNADERFIKNLGAGSALAGAVFFPVFGFLYLYTLPLISRSAGVFVLGAVSLLLLFLVSICVLRTIWSPAPRFGARAFVLFLAIFALTAVGDQISLVSATREHIAALTADAEERKAEAAREREEMMAKAVEADPRRGEEVFNTSCITCHRMDQRLVGPPLNSVLPKYEGRMDELVGFIRNPVKVNPEYPPMPNPGLPLADIRAVAAYLAG